MKLTYFKNAKVVHEDIVSDRKCIHFLYCYTVIEHAETHAIHNYLSK